MFNRHPIVYIGYHHNNAVFKQNRQL